MKPTDFIVEHNPFIAADADEMHRDQEVQMARSDLYAAADYAIKLHKILRGVSDSADMEQWVMEKISIANENLRTVYEYLNYEAREQEGAMPAFAFESAEQKFNSLLEGVAETVPMSDAVKVLKQYGADNFKTTTNELHFYKNGKGFSVDLVMNDDTTRSVPLSSLNSAARGLKGYGVAEGAELKKVKREYNQAAKDAGGDRVGAGKTIDNMKKSLRQKDVDNKKVEESCDAGATGAGAMATGAVGAIAPQRRVKQESAATKKYGNAMKTKAPKIGKGVY